MLNMCNIILDNNVLVKEVIKAFLAVFPTVFSTILPLIFNK